jgi:hypothetical protein
LSCSCAKNENKSNEQTVKTETQETESLKVANWHTSIGGAKAYTVVFDSCEYVLLFSEDANVLSIAHKRNCMFCAKRNIHILDSLKKEINKFKWY